jgi:hypothetical protein
LSDGGASPAGGGERNPRTTDRSPPEGTAAEVEAAVRQLVERAVDVPEAEEFGAIDLEFRDAGLALANEVRQASVASRKKRGT